MTTPEGRVKTKLDRMLKAEGVWYFPPQAGPYGRAGIPDRILCVSGVFIAVECKADESKSLTALQEKCKKEILEAGGIYLTAYDNDSIEEVRKAICAYRTRSEEDTSKTEESSEGNGHNSERPRASGWRGKR